MPAVYERARIDSKLGDENFTARAPEHVVEAQHLRRAEAEAARAKLAAALEHISGNAAAGA